MPGFHVPLLRGATSHNSVASDISHDTAARSLCSRDGRGVRPYTIWATGFAG
jgi:hypothetical protein